MLMAYRTFAATAAILGVTVERVTHLVDYGPLVARAMSDGSRLIHAEDLAAFRRPFSLATSESGGLSALCKLFDGKAEGASAVRASPQLATERDRGEAVATGGVRRANHLRLVRS